MFLNYHKESIPSHQSNAWATTGNFGASGQNQIFFDRKPTSDFFFEDAIEYGYVENDKFVLDHSDKICSIEQFSEHGFTVQAETDTGVQYTYKTSEDDETILEYYGTWDETKYADNYSGSASLFR